MWSSLLVLCVLLLNFTSSLDEATSAAKKRSGQDGSLAARDPKPPKTTTNQRKQGVAPADAMFKSMQAFCDELNSKLAQIKTTGNDPTACNGTECGSTDPLERAPNKTFQQPTVNTDKQERAAILIRNEAVHDSLIVFCKELNKYNSPSAQIEEGPISVNGSGSIPISRTVQTKTTTATYPVLFPVKFQGLFQGENVWLFYDVTHTMPINVYNKFYCIDIETIPLDHREKTSESTDDVPITSQVRMRVDLPFCAGEGKPRHKFVTTGFSIKDRSSYFVFASINICLMAQYANLVTYDGQVQRVEHPSKIFNQAIRLPYYKITSPKIKNDKILIAPGENLSIEMEARVLKNAWFRLEVTMWDKTKKRNPVIEVYSLKREAPSNKIVLSRQKRKKKYFFIAELSTGGKRGNATSFDEEVAYVRMTVITGIKKRSGILKITSGNIFFNEVVELLETSRKISLKNSNKSSNLRTGFLIISDPVESFQCIDYRNWYDKKQGMHCSVMCEIDGRFLKRIQITKTGAANASLTKSKSFIADGHTYGYSVLDLGLPLHTINGEYQCTGQTKDGVKKHRKFTLRLSALINVTNISITKASKDEVIVTCVAYGKGSVEMALYSVTEDGVQRLDNKTENTRVKKTYASNHITKLHVRATKNQITSPRAELLKCVAIGPSGRSSYSMPSPYSHALTHGDTITMNDYGNGTVEIVCTSTSWTPADMVISVTNPVKDKRIDKKSGNIRTETISGYRKTLRVLVKKKYLSWKKEHVLCGAFNEFGQKWIGLKIPRPK